jgi:superfamily I DNA and/or RNA helicase
MGATVYGLARAVQAGLAADVLVVDEGSQMKWGELSLALDVLKPGGRLIIAGDDLQLPPIMAGRYPPPEDGLPGLEDSIFAYLRARDNPAAPYTQQLTENWRMHQRLSDFAATTLYGAAYRPATPEVASRRLSLPPSSHPLWPLLDPDYPLTLWILEDVQAAQENLVEAELVAGLATLLREQTPSEIDDTTFWKESLFIVSPHHLQIRAIRKELSRLRHWRSSPFVDTVDKMQGQEAKAVIVSYGVSDRETALQEAGFIYSLNRLNVSITRAQAKCVVFLPRPLLQPSFDVLDDDKAALGLGHMNALLRYCQTHGHEVRLEGGPRMTVWRA